MAMKFINVFISSAMRELECERDVITHTLIDMNTNPVLFELFPAMSHSPIAAYTDEVRHCDIFILVLWKSLTEAVLNEYHEAVRCNKPILILIKTLAYAEKRDNQLKEFINALEKPDKIFTVRCSVYRTFRTIYNLEKVTRDSIAHELSKFYKEPRYTQTREDCYELGTDIVKQSQTRLLIYQKTPSIILGARPYLAAEHNKISYEKTLIDTIEDWINRYRALDNKELVYLFSLDAMIDELYKHDLIKSSAYMAALRERIEIFINLEEATGQKFKVRPAGKDAAGPIIVGDNRYAMTLIDKDHAVAISHENGKICDILFKMMKVYCGDSLREIDLFAKLPVLV